MSIQPIVTKAELQKRIDAGWNALNAYIDGLTEAQMTSIHDAHGWCARDHLTHLAAWERSVVSFLQGRPRHEGLQIDPALYASGSFDDMNAVIQQQHKDLSSEQAIRLLQDTHAQLMALLQALTDEQLNQPVDRFHPEVAADDQRLAADLISDNTADHFTEHLAWIQAMVST